MSTLEMSTLVIFTKRILLFLGFLLFPIHTLFASDTETEKIQWHLHRVEGILRKVDTTNLTEEQNTNRVKMLDRLRLYTEVGKFPNNDKFPGESVPFFRGSNGNLCAVGHLMDADPEYKTFIESIVKSNNTIEIMDTQQDTTINAWAKKYGFSILELAMIQPTYPWHYYCSFEDISDCSSTELVKLVLMGLFALYPFIFFGLIIIIMGCWLYDKQSIVSRLIKIAGLFALISLPYYYFYITIEFVFLLSLNLFLFGILLFYYLRRHNMSGIGNILGLLLSVLSLIVAILIWIF